MTRWPLILLTLALAGSVAAVVGRRAAEPDQPDPPLWTDVAQESVPEVVILRILAKRHIALETAAGKRSLVQAAALYRVLNELPPALPPADHPCLDGRIEEEGLCWQVILYVANREDDGPQTAAAVARLEAELQEELCRHGTIQLPDPAGLPSATDLLEEARATMTEAERRACFPTRRGAPPGP
jgi:hypothetical protein